MDKALKEIWVETPREIMVVVLRAIEVEDHKVIEEGVSRRI